MRLSKEERLSYQKKEAIAVYGLSNFGGIAVIDILYDTDDYIVWYDDQIEAEKRKIHVSKIYYTTGKEFAEPFFRPYGSLYIKLSECLKVWEKRKKGYNGMYPFFAYPFFAGFQKPYHFCFFCVFKTVPL